MKEFKVPRTAQAKNFVLEYIIDVLTNEKYSRGMEFINLNEHFIKWLIKES